MSDGTGNFSVDIPTNMASTPAPVAAPADGGAASGAPDFMSFVPAEYKDSPWVADYAKAEKPIEALFKGYANAQTLIGKKTENVGIPGTDATPEQISAFHKAIGVPEKPEAYEYTPADLASEPESVRNVISQLSKDQTLINNIREIAHKEGITPKQFNSLVAKYDAHTLEQVKAIVANNETARADYVAQQSAKVKEIYGDKSESAHNIAKEMAIKVLPENVRNTKDPEIALLAALNFIHEQGYASDTIVKPSAAPTETPGDIRAEIMATRQTDAFKRFDHPNNAATKQKLQALYDREAALKQK